MYTNFYIYANKKLNYLFLREPDAKGQGAALDPHLDEGERKRVN
jgi:hypothetical protein